MVFLEGDHLFAATIDGFAKKPRLHQVRVIGPIQVSSHQLAFLCLLPDLTRLEP